MTSIHSERTCCRIESNCNKMTNFFYGPLENFSILLIFIEFAILLFENYSISKCGELEFSSVREKEVKNHVFAMIQRDKFIFTCLLFLLISLPCDILKLQIHVILLPINFTTSGKIEFLFYTTSTNDTNA